MAFILNPFTGQFDANGLTTTTLNSLYLRLDTTNSPLTGNLEINSAIPTFQLTDTVDTGSFLRFKMDSLVGTFTVDDGGGTYCDWTLENNGALTATSFGSGIYSINTDGMYWALTVAPSAGRNKTIFSEAAVTFGGTPNLNGGDLTLKGGDAIGNGISSVYLYATGGGSSGTSTRASQLVLTANTTGITTPEPIFATNTSEYSLFGAAPDSGFITLANATDRLAATISTASGVQLIRAIAAVSWLEASGTTLHSSGITGNTVFVGTSSTSSGNLTSSTSGNGGGFRGYRGVMDFNGSFTSALVTLSSLFTGGLRMDGTNTTVTDYATFHSEGVLALASGNTATRIMDLWIRSGSIPVGTNNTRIGIRIDTLGTATNNIAMTIGGTGTGAGIHFNATTAVGTERIYSGASQTIDLEAKTTIEFVINTTKEAIITADNLTFQNGASTTALNWKTSGKLDFQVAAASEMSLTANTLTFANGATNTQLSWATSGQLDFQVGAASEMRLTANTLTFENGATDTQIDWATSGVMNLQVGATTQLAIAAGSLTVTDATNIVVGSTTGTKIGTATSQKLSVWNATPIVQPTTAVAAATFVANTSGIVDDSATFDGYTIGQVVKALRNIGLLA